MIILNWNLQKKGLVSWALRAFNPDFALFQEHWLLPNRDACFPNYEVHHTISLTKKGSPCGTAVYAKDGDVVNVMNIATSQKEFFIKARKTATAVQMFDKETGKLFWLMSVHGYNGWPTHNVTKFALSIAEFIRALPPNEPAIIAGDFNTFTEEHLAALNVEMVALGFSRRISIPYDKKKTLDHVYTRGATASLITSGHDESDHPFIVFEAKIL